MTIDPYSIPPPRGWSPSVNPDQQMIAPPIGSIPIGQPIPPPRGWSPPIEPSQQIGASFAAYSPSSNLSTNSYPLQPPIGGFLPRYTVAPPRGWSPSVATDPALLPPPRALPAPEEYEQRY